MSREKGLRIDLGLARWALVALVIVIAATPAAARAKTRPPALACGDIVTQSVRLNASLTGCSTGLIVGADGIAIDLDGYSIEGIGAGVGVQVSGWSDVTVRNGKIRGFGVGVSLAQTVRAKATRLTISDAQTGISTNQAFDLSPLDANVITQNTIVGVSTGIVAVGGSDRVEQNTITGASNNGVFLRGGFDLPGTRVAGNTITQGRVGIFQFDCEADLDGNTVTGNTGDGIVVSDSHGTVINNIVSGNGGSGIVGIDSHELFRRNITNQNGGHGLIFSDVFGPHGPLLEVTRHTANDNGGYGVFTSLADVVDGGKNRAHGNGNEPQCVGVVCT
jgi:parallel beta-helix repeat protein